MSIYSGTRGYLDGLEVGDVGRFEEEMLRYLRDQHGDILDTIRDEKELSDATEEKLKSALGSFAKSFTA